MGIRILAGEKINEDNVPAAVLYDSTGGVAFGPVFADEEEAEVFLHFWEQQEGRPDPSQWETTHQAWLAAGKTTGD